MYFDESSPHRDCSYARDLALCHVACKKHGKVG